MIPGKIEPSTPDAAERERLAELAARGDCDAFSRLADAYRRHLWQHAHGLCRDEHRADDLVQETFLRAWQMRESYVVGASSSWLKWCKRILQRLAIDEWRRDRAMPCVSLDACLGDAGSRESIASLRDPAPLAHERLRAKEDAERARRIVAALPDRQRQVLSLLAEGHSREEIGRMFGTARNTVRIYLYRARTAVRESLADS
ncbi:RNA polymerase sigma factor [Candidatus Poribacteria bacterium]|nr:RNA polymerase sigma factor [Candidatus Poribacteria bacterium]